MWKTNTLEALDNDLITIAPDDLDWKEEIRINIEERASFSPDALTGLEANLRFPGKESCETKFLEGYQLLAKLDI